MTPDDPRHGTRNGYRDGNCRCEACRRAVAYERNLYELRRMANGGRPLMVDKLGSVRRLQALMTLGWSRRELARQAGYTGDAFGPILNGQRRCLWITTARRIDELFDRLSMTQGPSNPARLAAAKKGWPPPLAWDDIDDPDEIPGTVEDDDQGYDPVVVERVLGGDWRMPSTAAERTEIARRWYASGHSLTDLERLAGFKPDRYYRLSDQGDAA